MALVSPGVEVNVIDESFYTPAAAGTVPMIFVATATNKTKSSGTGTAAGTTKANAGKPYLITSQRELGETFGDPLFYSDNNGNMVHGGELNEYGLQAAYSALGVSNRVYVVRADLDTAALTASATAPGGDPANGAYWFDTSVSNYGILEWNGLAVTETGGQTFAAKTPTVITVVTDLSAGLASAPKASIGQIGNYAIDANDTMNRVYYKTPGFGTSAQRTANAGTWVELGSDDWKSSWAATRGTASNPVLTNADSITINGTDVPLSGTDIAAMVTAINAPAVDGVTAALVDGSIEIYANSLSESDGITADGIVTLAAGTGDLLSDLGLTAGSYSSPRLEAAAHTAVPAYKSGDTTPAPSGSVWIKTTTPNGGAKLSIKQYSAATQLWSTVTTPIYNTPEGAIYGLDKTGGGANLLAGALYAKVNVDELDDPIGNYKVYSRVAAGATSVVGTVVTSIAAGTYTFTLQETKANTATLPAAVTVSATTTGATTDADVIAAAINAKGMTNVVALVDSQNRVVIQHKLGGDIKIVDTDGGLALAGFSSANTANLYAGANNVGLVASNWKPLVYTASGSEPLSLAADGQLWYNSVVDEVDILVHNGDAFVGLNYDGSSGLSDTASPYSGTNAEGPIVSATEPTTQTDVAQSPLVNGDIWVSTADIENYPAIYRWNTAYYLQMHVKATLAEQQTMHQVQLLQNCL